MGKKLFIFFNLDDFITFALTGNNWSEVLKLTVLYFPLTLSSRIWASSWVDGGGGWLVMNDDDDDDTRCTIVETLVVVTEVSGPCWCCSWQAASFYSFTFMSSASRPDPSSLSLMRMSGIRFRFQPSPFATWISFIEKESRATIHVLWICFAIWARSNL